MKLWRLVLMLAAIAAGCASRSVMLTPEGVEVSVASLSKEEAKQLGKMQDSLYHERAAKALKASDFVVEAERLSHERGNSEAVSPVTNFVAVKGDQATIQFAPSISGGVNDMGGATFGGKISNVRINTDKHGGATYAMVVSSAGLSATVVVRLSGGSDRAVAEIKTNYNNFVVKLEGNLVPTSASKIYYSGSSSTDKLIQGLSK